MKVAAPYPLREDRQLKINEYNIDFRDSKNKINDLMTWIRKPRIKEKRINLRMPEKSIDLDKLIFFNELHDNFYIRLQPNQLKLIENFKKEKIKFFFDYDFNINSFCQLKDAIEQGTTDVYITEDLCYKLPQVKKICEKDNIQMRLIANMIHSFTLGKEKD